MNRRKFLTHAAQAGIAVAGSSLLAPRPRARAKDLANGRITVCCTGVKGRGNNLFNSFGAAEDVDVKYVCDIDSQILGSRQGEFESKFNRRPEAISDYRRALDDQQVDALVLGTPDHWHALPTIHACQAGKDCYTEKPDGHNLVEGQVMTAAAKKYGRVVQLGTQARSDPSLHELLAYVKQGVLGRVIMAKAWESMQQKNLGKPADCDPPATIDYDVWLGPAPKRPFNPLRFHGNWRWFFDYGAGDLANDGVHRLDFARWFLEAAVEGSGEKPIGLPRSTSASGGKYYFDDAQEWPDTMLVTYDYPGRLLTYEMRVWAPYPLEGEAEGAAIFGDKGYLIIGGRSWRHFGPKGVLIKEGTRGGDADKAHVRNFLDCMRSRAKPNADLETVGRPSSLLCHMGNIAWRVGRTVKFDYDTYSFVGDDEANALRTRAEYRKPYVLPKAEEV